MSKDFCFYKISRIEDKIPPVIPPDSEYQNDESICIVRSDIADEWMKIIGQRTTVEYLGCDLSQLSFDKFGIRYDCAHYLWNSGYDFYSNDKYLGRVSREEISKYEKVMQYEAFLFKREKIHAPEEKYAIYNMEDRLYSEEELLKIAEDIENSSDCESYEVLYTLYKCAYLARNGYTIWCNVE